MCIDIMRKERGQALKSVRKAKGITQGQAAILSGVSLPTVIRMELGKVSWSIDSELRIMQALSVLPPKQPKVKQPKK
jgi:transcriptional regulator with XRE-family HTH domain